MMTDGYTFNRVKFTQDEETCIRLLLTEARDLGYPSNKEKWYPMIDSIFQKFFNSNIQEAQEFQTL
jgi:hypothetical protein